MTVLRLGLLTSLLFALSLSASQAQSLITMSNKCVERVDNGQAALDTENYQEAITRFNEVLDKCSARGGKEAGNVGLAMAYNGLKEYDQAINYANTALDVSKNTNINAYFARGIAYGGKNQSADAQADFQEIISITEKNQNVKERATMFAEVADLSRKQGMYDDANNYIDQAIAIDAQNPKFYVQKGDLAADLGDLDAAFKEYDHAVDLGMDGLEMYKIRTEVRVNAMENKYGTSKANELKSKMTSEETNALCDDLKKAFDLGLKDFNLDLFKTMLCP